MQREATTGKGKVKPPLVVDANIIFDLQCAGVLLLVFSLDYTFITTDLIENELKSVNPNILRSAGLKVHSLSGSQMAEAYKLHAEYRKGPSIKDISAFIYARDNNMTLATRDSGLWQVAADQNVPVKETHDLIRALVEADVLTYKEGAKALSKALARLPVQRLDWADLIKDWHKR